MIIRSSVVLCNAPLRSFVVLCAPLWSLVIPISALLRGNWQDFNWHDASRGPSAIAELLVCYKMLHGLCDISLPVDYACRNTHGNYLKLNKQFCFGDVRMYFFNSTVIDAWNSLCNDVVKSPSVCIFKKRLHSVNLSRFLTITCWLFLAVYSFFFTVFSTMYHLSI